MAEHKHLWGRYGTEKAHPNRKLIFEVSFYTGLTLLATTK